MWCAICIVVSAFVGFGFGVFVMCVLAVAKERQLQAKNAQLMKGVKNLCEWGIYGIENIAAACGVARSTVQEWLREDEKGGD